MDHWEAAEREREVLQGPDIRPPLGATGSGPYPALVEGDPTHAIYRPQSLDGFGTPAQLPIVAWGNGGCMNSSFPFRNFLLEIASHGFLVVAIGPAQEPATEPVIGSTQASQLLDAIDWAMAEHNRPTSSYAGKLATDKISVSAGALNTLDRKLAADSSLPLGTAGFVDYRPGPFLRPFFPA